jgi:hypothetical protein
MNTKLSVISHVLKQPFYALIASSVSLGLGSLYYLLTLSVMPAPKVIEMLGLPYLAASIGLTFATAILAGINIALLVFKIKGSQLITVKGSGTTAFGSSLMAFTPGCPACTTPLAAVLSTVGGLAIFPLQGLELKLMSLAALSYSIYWVLKGLQHKVHPVRQQR